MVTKQRQRLDHGFSIANIAMLVILVLIFWAIHWGRIVVPQVRQTADQVANLNKLHDVDLKGKIGGCIPFELKGII